MTEAVEKLTTLRRLCEASGQPFYVEILDEVLALLSSPVSTATEEVVERVARAMVRAQFNEWEQLDGGDHGYWCGMTAKYPEYEPVFPRPKHPQDDYLCQFCGGRMNSGDSASVFADTCNGCAEEQGWFDDSLPTSPTPQKHPDRNSDKSQC